MGFLSSIKDFGHNIAETMRDPDFADKLAQAQAILADDPKTAMLVRQQMEQRHAADRAAEMMERQGIGRPQGPVYAPEELTPVSAMEHPSRAAPLLPMSDGPSAPSPTVPAPSAPPVGVPNLPQAQAEQPKSLYAALLPDLIRASGRGANVSPAMAALANEDYVGGLPMKDQALARAVGADKYAGWEHDANKPVYNETGPGNTWSRYDPTTKTNTPIFTAPDRPQPVTTDRVAAAIQQKFLSGEKLSPQEQEIYNRWKAGSDGFYGERAPHHDSTIERIVGKLDRGEALGPGEQQYWDAYKARGGSGTGANSMGDQTDEAPPAPPPAAPPGAAPLPPKDKPKPPASPPLNLLQEGRMTKFDNGQVWTKRGGKAVRLK